MKLKKEEMQRKRDMYGVCGCMAGLDRKTKIWIKIIVALVVVGVGLGVGLGVSKAVGGGIWKSNSSPNAPITNVNS